MTKWITRPFRFHFVEQLRRGIFFFVDVAPTENEVLTRCGFGFSKGSLLFVDFIDIAHLDGHVFDFLHG